MQVSDRQYLPQFHDLIGKDIDRMAETFDFGRKGDDMGYQIQASAVYSSNIEGNSIDLNSFMNHRLSEAKTGPQKEIQEIEDLIEAYQFAQKELLTEKAFLKAHGLLSKQLVIKGLRGKYRNDKVGVFGQSGLIYLAIEAEYLTETMRGFFADISVLLTAELTLEEAFYHASLIHLRFVHIHPFRDGNGRAARLLEKWFLAQKAGTAYWQLPSEKYYKDNRPAYYTNINMGINFYVLDYDKCLPFLVMLPNAMKE